MYLPPEIIDLVFDFIDVKPVIYAIDEIHQHNEEIYNLEYFSTGSIGRATYSLFLKRRKLIKEYTDSILIYHVFCQTCIYYWIKSKAHCLEECFTKEDKELLNLMRFNKL